MTRRNFALPALVGAVTLVLSSCGGGAEGTDGDSVSLDIAHVFTDGTPIAKSAVTLSERVAEATDGRVEFRPFGNSQLGADTELAESLSNQNLDCAILNHPASGLDPRLQLGFLPYVVTNYEDADELFYGDGYMAQKATEVLEEHDLTVLTYVENDFRALSNDSRAVTSPDDLKGLKIRVPELPMYIDLFKSWGAQPVAMAYAELYTALQQGTVDGQDNGAIVTSDSKYSEVQDHFTPLNHAYSTAAMTCTNEAFSQISEEDQAAIMEIAEEISVEEREENRKVAQERIQQLADEGVEISELTEEQTQAFAEVATEIWDAQASTFGEDTIAGLREAVEAVRGD